MILFVSVLFSRRKASTTLRRLIFLYRRPPSLASGVSPYHSDLHQK